MFSKSKSLLVLALAISSFSVVADSDNTGWFVGGTLGGGHADFSIDDYGAFGIYNIEYDETSFLSGPFAGYNVNPWFGIDSQLLLGSYGFNDAAIFSMTPRASFPLSPEFSLFVRGGLATMVFVDEDDDDEVFSGVAPTFGFGARIDIVDKVKLNVAFDYAKGEMEYDNDSVLDGTDVDVEHMTGTVSVYYQF